MDALLVLGCALDREGRPSPALRRRLDAALEAWEQAREQARAPRVLVSGGRRWFGQAEASVMAAYLIQRGVPSERILPELHSLDTRGNAAHSFRLAEPLGIRRIVLVTCDFHMARAIAHFRRVGFACEPHAAVTPGGVRLGVRLRERLIRALDFVR